MESITIPESVKSIGYSAFYGTGLTSINISENVSSIGYGAFSNCSSMTSINVSPNNKAFKSKEGVLFNYTENELLCYPAGKMDKYFIPFDVEKISDCAFSSCKYLSSITIPNSVISIGNFAFSNCLNLNSVTYNGTNDPGIDSNAFNECNQLIKVNVPAYYNGNTFCDKNIFRIQTEPNVTNTNNSNTVIIAATVSVAAILVIAGITVVICFHKKSSSKYEDENVQV